MKLSKIETVLQYRESVGASVISVIFEAPHQRPIPDVYLDFLQKDWDDMGRPEVITVTIQPGDRLNPPYDPRRGE